MRYPLTITLITLACTASAAIPHVIEVTPENREQLGFETCPPINYLVKDPSTMFWATKQKGFRSYDVSFAQHITRFLGAQWEGVNLGTIYCLYQGDNMTFTVNLRFHALSYTPNGGNWTKDLGGLKNCITSDPNNCLFKPYVKKSTNIYKELDSIKPGKSSSVGF